MALQVLAELIAEEPEASDAHLSQAVLLYQLGRLDDALSALARAEATLRPADRQSEPEDPQRRIELLRLQVLHGLGRHDEANALAAKLLPRRYRSALGPAYRRALTPFSKIRRQA